MDLVTGSYPLILFDTTNFNKCSVPIHHPIGAKGCSQDHHTSVHTTELLDSSLPKGSCSVSFMDPIGNQDDHALITESANVARYMFIALVTRCKNVAHFDERQLALRSNLNYLDREFNPSCNF